MEEQHFLFTHLQLFVGRVELVQQNAVGQRLRGRRHQVAALAAQRSTQVPQILLQLPVLRFQLMSLHRKGTFQYTCELNTQKQTLQSPHPSHLQFFQVQFGSANSDLLHQLLFRRTYTYYREGKNAAAGEKIKRVMAVRGFTLAFACRAPSFSSSRSRKFCLFCSSSFTFLWSCSSTGSSSEGCASSCQSNSQQPRLKVCRQQRERCTNVITEAGNDPGRPS